MKDKRATEDLRADDTSQACMKVTHIGCLGLNYFKLAICQEFLLLNYNYERVEKTRVF